MRSLNRKKLTAGCLTLVSIAWTIDMVTGDASPPSAQASLVATSSGAPLLPTDPPDRAVLERFLFSDDTSLASPDFERATRDPFSAFDSLRAQLAPPIAASETAPAEAVATPAAEAARASFAERHKLQGVITGATPVALVDGRALSVGAVLDGYRLIIIERDRVVFEQDEQQETLTLPRPHLP